VLLTYDRAERARAAIVRAAVCIAVSVFGLANSHGAEIGGYVVELAGRWSLQKPDARELQRWDDVPAGAVIRIDAPRATDRLRIVDRQGVPIVARDCSVSDACVAPIEIPGARANDSNMAVRLIGALIGKLKSNPDRPASHISRSDTALDAPKLADRVIALTAAGSDIAPVLATLVKGRYLARIAPVVRDADNDFATAPITLDWEPGAQLRIPAQSLARIRPGLYEFTLLRADSGRARAYGIPAWILFVAPDRYDAAAASWAEGAAITTRWAEQIDPITTRTVLRTFMEELAGEFAQ
jgi:hypothetical protein